jgi:hypothetical protein
MRFGRVGVAAILLMGVASYVAFLSVAASGGRFALERWAFAATIVGPLIVIAGTILIVAQVREAANAVRGQLFDATSSRILMLDQLFLDHPELRCYFYGGKSVNDATDAERPKIMTIAEMHIDFFDTELLRRKLFPASLRGFPAFDPWIRHHLRNCDATCMILREDLDRDDDCWYGEILKIYDDEVAKGLACWPVSDAQSVTT